jgi:hypothetical protein
MHVQEKLLLLDQAVLVLEMRLVLVPAGEAVGADLAADDEAHVLGLDVALDQASTRERTQAPGCNTSTMDSET